MKKLLTLMMMMLMLVAFGVATAEAAGTATIGVTVTVTAATLDISVGPIDWAIGTLLESGTLVTAGNAYTVTNNTTNATVDLSIISGNSADWQAADTIGVAEKFVMKAECKGVMTAINTSQALADDVAPSGTYAFDLGFQAPSSTAHAGVQQLITVTISAAI